MTLNDVQDYYRRVTDVDIGEIARDLLAGRITQESPRTLFCDCPNHRSQSHRSLHIMLDKQGWYCFGCGMGGDVLQLVEFVHHGVVTRGQSGRMPESHRQARDFLAARVGMPPLSKLGAGPADLEEIEEAHRLTLRVWEALTVLAELYHERLLGHPEVLGWFRSQYGIGDETIARLKIGFADNGEPSVIQALINGAGAFTMRELAATSAFRPTAQDSLVPFFEGRIVFPYWSRGHVVFMIGRRTPWTPDQPWEKSKYKKLAVHNDRNHSHVAPCIRNDVLYNEDVLLARPERIIITEGVTDCISLMERGFPAVSPVTVQIREADWERLLPKLAGVKTAYICQDNEVSEAGLNGALRTARVLAGHGILTRLAILPLGEKQQNARRELTQRFGVDAAAGTKDLAKQLEGKTPEEVQEAEALLADAKIDVNEFFAAGKTAEDFEELVAGSQTPLELAISRLDANTPDEDIGRLLEPILTEIGQLNPIEQDRHLKLIQNQIGKAKLPVSTLRRQLKVVVLDHRARSKYGRSSNGGRQRGAQTLAMAQTQGQPGDDWRSSLLLNLNGTIKPVLANAITALRAAPEWAGVLEHNEFAHCTVMQRPAPWMPPDTRMPLEWATREDILTTEWLHHQGIFVSAEVTGQAVEAVAGAHPFHPVRQYLRGLQWDGTARLYTWLSTYLGVERSGYATAVGSRWMISAIARVFEPGCKADCCLILEGPQGIKKSTALRVLAEPWFTDEIADLGSKDGALQTRGVWVIEIAELDSMSRSEVGRIKAFMSRSTDRFRPPYGKRPIESPRQCVFAGSVNHSTYLRDETGGRRFWPVECQAPVIDVDALARDRDQLWAEAVSLYFDGKVWWLDSVELNRQAADEQADRYEGDPWDELIMQWAAGRESVSIEEVLSLCLEKRKDQWTQWDKIRVARCLRAHGWERFKCGPRESREWRYRRLE
jgi:predicted P-loop ATPase/DNA primase